MNADVIVIGAGASGLMCAIEAGMRGRKVLVLEHTDRIGSKISLSGGGRCNFSNRQVSREHYLSRNPHFATSALSRFTPDDFIAILKKHRIDYEEREAGQLFCKGSSRDIIDMLKGECDRAGVSFLFGAVISAISMVAGPVFQVATSRGTFVSEALAVATGGLSRPDIGATSSGYAIAKQFGMKVTPLKPALTPLLFSRKDKAVLGTLTGISFDAAVSCGGARFRGDVLFTHRGLSGPAILQISSYWDRGDTIIMDLFPDHDIHATLIEQHQRRMLLTTLLDHFLPGRFVKTWCDLHFPSRPLNQYSAKELEALADSLHGWQLQPAGAEGFNKAEVTLGGIDTDELSSKTMESKKVPGLYFLGELIDVTGHLGGYNLHWAWASGHAAGQYV